MLSHQVCDSPQAVLIKHLPKTAAIGQHFAAAELEIAMTGSDLIHVTGSELEIARTGSELEIARTGSELEIAKLDDWSRARNC